MESFAVPPASVLHGFRMVLGPNPTPGTGRKSAGLLGRARATPHPHRPPEGLGPHAGPSMDGRGGGGVRLVPVRPHQALMPSCPTSASPQRGLGSQRPITAAWTACRGAALEAAGSLTFPPIPDLPHASSSLAPSSAQAQLHPGLCGQVRGGCCCSRGRWAVEARLPLPQVFTPQDVPTAAPSTPNPLLTAALVLPTRDSASTLGTAGLRSAQPPGEVWSPSPPKRWQYLQELWGSEDMDVQCLASQGWWALLLQPQPRGCSTDQDTWVLGMSLSASVSPPPLC